ncbi:medium chain dehydrogenase/reductase family protein [Candidatus Pelagibacter bacterium nBUS_44]|uniref:MDR/zinc-dependent alcohol dehydrogenase-like family protein n=1 Tax=Candidatus Pelagibacter bacterium nBUS_44 TaxID=3374195 RepID=UPI003EC031B0
MYFKAAVLLRKNKIKILDIKKPILKKSQLFVKVLFSSICHTQLSEIKGERGIDKFLPHCLGHEGVGVIKDKHKSVKKFKINDLVCLSWIKSVGKDSGGVIYEDANGLKINGGPVHTLNEYAAISENRLYKINKDKNIKSKVLLGCAFSTAFNALKDIQLKPSKTICILGCGGLGLATVLIAKKIGYKNIIVVDKVKSKLQNAKKLGATNLAFSIDKIKIEKIDIVVECTGNKEVLKKSILLPKKFGGKLVFIGNYPNKTKINFDPWTIINGVSFLGAWHDTKPFNKIFKKLENILKNENLDIFFGKKIYKLKHINNAIKDFEEGKVVRPLIKF